MASNSRFGVPVPKIRMHFCNFSMLFGSLFSSFGVFLELGAVLGFCWDGFCFFERFAGVVLGFCVPKNAINERDFSGGGTVFVFVFVFVFEFEFDFECGAVFSFPFFFGVVV